MFSPTSFFGRLRRVRAAAIAPVCVGVSLLAASSLQAVSPLPQNLGPGLNKLVESRLAFKAAKASGQRLATTARAASGVQYATQQAADIADNALGDDQGRVMVMINLNGLVPFKAVKKALKSIDSLTITAVDKSYRAGVLEGFISVDDAAAAATISGVSNVLLENQPEIYGRAGGPVSNPNVVSGQQLTLLGTAFDQGVTQHRVDTINKFYNPNAAQDYEGQGMSIGFISDSYNKSTNAIKAPNDVASFDLPGDPNNPTNTTPVFVIADYTATGTDEGRAMVQIGYKMAPKAKLGFGTANSGEVGFANTIRGLAGINSTNFPNAATQGFKAQVICDDVGYSDEPFFEDGIVGNAVNDVFNAGVAYFSSAGNDVGTYDYDSDFRYVPYTSGTTAADSPALAGTNINLANVPTNLYAGGFHNFNPNGGQNVALKYNLNVATGSLPATNFQWTDPYNQTVSYNTPAIYTAPGNGGTDGSVTPSTFTTPSLTAGANYVIIVKATNNSPFDAIVTVKDPNGNTVVNAQDTGTDETINFYPSVTGAYTIQVAQFTSTAPTYPGGSFEVDVYTGNNALISTDFNLLAFDLEGNYLPGSSLVTNNYSTNIPFEYGKTPPLNASATSAGEAAVQYVVARASVPTQANPANHFRILVRGNGLSGIGPAQYYAYNTPNTKGHAMAQGCNGTAAYSVFRPSVPEYYTSPGPATVYFDNIGTRLATPEVRLQPRVAAADNASNSFFASDSAADLDLKPNFSGTSAAAPHAAAVAALVIQAHGGPGSLTPLQTRSILQSTAFPHDLDPNSASGLTRVLTNSGSGKLLITASSDLGLNPNAGAANPNSISVSYVGPSSIASITFNTEGTAATGGNTTGGNNGVDGATTSPVTYFNNLYPGLVFEPATIPFTVGNGSAALASTTATFSNLAPAPSNGTNQYWTATLNFPTGAFTGGNVFNFTVGHGPQHNSSVQGTGVAVQGTGPTGGATSTSFTQADLFGGSILLPNPTGAVQDGTGMTFKVTMADGTTATGTMKNRIGAGYSVLDGYGFLNAEAATAAPAP